MSAFPAPIRTVIPEVSGALMSQYLDEEVLFLCQRTADGSQNSSVGNKIRVETLDIFPVSITFETASQIIGLSLLNDKTNEGKAGLLLPDFGMGRGSRSGFRRRQWGDHGNWKSGGASGTSNKKP
ncbi:hypothetical protein MPER_01540 [Moniliophthora perniciosa FA553]|nr:hypothetical protein MPER_01540 [Moniliophthora perniciosa FA553]